VSPSPGGREIRVVLLDIEGTTTPITFVYDVLFPYVREHLREHLHRHRDTADLREAVASLRDEWRLDREQGVESPPPWIDGDPESAAPYIEWLMDRDRKSRGLKLLQGQIWNEGYTRAILRGEVYDDVPAAFERWTAGGRTLAIYSSGSVLAQRLLFSTTRCGDLTRYLSAYFDTTIGPKTSAASYRAIADALQQPADALLFVSDALAELEAAQSAGCTVVLCDRAGQSGATAEKSRVSTIRSFDELD